jgi:hypothetical protein
MNARFLRTLVDEHLNLSLGPDRLNNHGSFPGRYGYVLRRFGSFRPDPTHPAAAASLAGRLRLDRASRPATEAISRPTWRHRLYRRGLQALIQLLLPPTGASSWFFTRNDSVPQSNSANRLVRQSLGNQPSALGKGFHIHKPIKGRFETHSMKISGALFLGRAFQLHRSAGPRPRNVPILRLYQKGDAHTENHPAGSDQQALERSGRVVKRVA